MAFLPLLSQIRAFRGFQPIQASFRTSRRPRGHRQPRSSQFITESAQMIAASPSQPRSFSRPRPSMPRPIRSSRITPGGVPMEPPGVLEPRGTVLPGHRNAGIRSRRPARSSVNVTIPLSTLNTGVPDLDEDSARQISSTRPGSECDLQEHPVEKGAMKDNSKSLGTRPPWMTKPVTLDVTLVKIGTNPRSSLPTVGFDALTRSSAPTWVGQVRAPGRRRG